MIYAIVGPTGVGKTAFSIELAKKLKAPILNCDSMQIYRELSIGVAKIKEEEKEHIPHYLLDICSIFDDFSVYDYQQIGRKVLDDLLQKYDNIIIVGGTGLYLKALLYDFDFKGKSESLKMIYPSVIVGLTRDRAMLYDAIDKRVDMMLDEGLVDEVKSFYNKNIRTRVLNTAIGYKELYAYFDGMCSFDEAVSSIKQASRRYAKRQMTFFRHQFPSIIWFDVDEISVKDRIDLLLKKTL